MYSLEGPRIYVGAHAAVPLVSWLCSTPELRVIITSNVKRDSHDNLSYTFTVLDNSRRRSSDDDSGGDQPRSGGPHLVDEGIAH
jgi:hypothetical protein